MDIETINQKIENMISELYDLKRTLNEDRCPLPDPWAHVKQWQDSQFKPRHIIDDHFTDHSRHYFQPK